MAARRRRVARPPTAHTRHPHPPPLQRRGQPVYCVHGHLCRPPGSHSGPADEALPRGGRTRGGRGVRGVEGRVGGCVGPGAANHPPARQPSPTPPPDTAGQRLWVGGHPRRQGPGHEGAGVRVWRVLGRHWDGRRVLRGQPRPDRWQPGLLFLRPRLPDLHHEPARARERKGGWEGGWVGARGAVSLSPGPAANHDRRPRPYHQHAFSSFLPPSKVRDATITRSILGDGCVIRAGATVEHSVVGLRTLIGPNAVIQARQGGGGEWVGWGREGWAGRLARARPLLLHRHANPANAPPTLLISCAGLSADGSGLL